MNEELTPDEQKLIAKSTIIGIPHNAFVTTSYMVSMLSLLGYEMQKLQYGGIPNLIGFEHHKASCYVAKNRNAIVRFVLDETSAQWLMMVDTDIAFPHTLLEQMLEDAHPEEKQVLFAPVLLLNGTVNLFRRVSPGVYAPYEKITHGDIFEIDAGGTGVVLIHRSALELMRRCYPDPWNWFDHDLVRGEKLGDDMTFCHRAKAVGIKLWGWCKVMPVHLKLQPVTFEGAKVVDYDPASEKGLA